jgi:ribonucleoside-diphosphate reductase beta chain
MHFITDRRAHQIGLKPIFGEQSNPFPWMSEAIDLKKEKNFFETRVTEYQSGSTLNWD